MSSSSALKHNIQGNNSFVAKKLVMVMFVISAIVLFLLWGASWFSSFILFTYVALCSYLIYVLKPQPLHFDLFDNGNIDVYKPISCIGKVSSQSFYNGWVIFLNVIESDQLLMSNTQKKHQVNRWFIVFNDSVAEEEYRLIARLINSARLT